MVERGGRVPSVPGAGVAIDALRDFLEPTHAKACSAPQTSTAWPSSCTRATISKQRPYGVAHARFLDSVLPQAPDVTVQMRTSPAPEATTPPPSTKWCRSSSTRSQSATRVCRACCSTSRGSPARGRGRSVRLSHREAPPRARRRAYLRRIPTARAAATPRPWEGWPRRLAHFPPRSNLSRMLLFADTTGMVTTQTETRRFLSRE